MSAGVTGHGLPSASLSLALLLFLPFPCSASEAPSIEDCDGRVRDAPREPFSYYCYVLAARAGGSAEEAAGRLEEILTRSPRLHRARTNLAMIRDLQSDPRAESLYREAAEGTRQVGDQYGEIYSRLGLAFLLGDQGRLDEVEAELARALEVAEAIDDPIMLARVWTQQATQSERRADYGRALGLFRQAAEVALPDGPADLQSTILSGLGSIYWHLGDFHQARLQYERQSDLLRSTGDLYSEASARYNITALMAPLLGREISWQELLDAQERALAVATRSGNLGVEISVRLDRAGGWLNFQSPPDPPRALIEAEKAMALSAQSGRLDDRLRALRMLARIQVFRGQDYDAGLRFLEQAIEEAHAARNLHHLARALILSGAIALNRDDRPVVIDSYLAAHDAIEEIRDLQPEGSVRARTFSRWMYAYYRLAGHLLTDLTTSPDPESDLELVFHTMERMRARVLLDSLDAAGASHGGEEHALHGDRDAVLREIARLQKLLLEPGMSTAERDSALDELVRLEDDEVDLRDRIARVDPVFAALHAPAFPTLKEIRAELADDQALLSFHLWQRRHQNTSDIGGSWMLAITSSGARAYEIPDRGILRRQIPVFRDLFDSRDGREVRTAVRLYRDLLQPALQDLPATVKRLVIIPDDILYLLPFAVLQTGSGAEPLASEYEISYAPSMTLWKRWQDRPPEDSGDGRLMALADPDLESAEADGPTRPGGEWLAGLNLSQLPNARREADRLRQAAAKGSTVLHAGEATEHSLKRADLRSFSILHFAAHAIVDEERPERTAILLAPGHADEDGLLQFREIVDLDLDGQLVLLSACRSVTGALVEGEGMMGLARAFFQAGARTVVGSLWPLRDDEAADLMEPFAAALGRGETVAGALATAQRRQIEKHRPAAAWAGLVLLGDGDQVPVPGRGSRVTPALWLAGLTGLLLLATVLFAVHRLSATGASRGHPHSPRRFSSR